MHQLTLLRVVAYGCLAAVLGLTACTGDDDASTTDSDDEAIHELEPGVWVTAPSAKGASWLDLPSDSQLTVTVSEDIPDVFSVSISLGCSRHGGAVDRLDPLRIPEPTIQGEQCEPSVDRAERRLAEVLLSGDARFRISGSRLVISVADDSVELAPEG